MIFYTRANPDDDFYPEAALSEAAGQPVRLGHDERGWMVVLPSGSDPATPEEGQDAWASYSTDPQPSLAAVRAWRPVSPVEGFPLTDVDIARNYAQAYQAAQDIIFLLMGRVAPALVIGKHFTPETVNAEGARFTRYHQPEIEAFKLAGRHPDAGDALYAAVEASAGLFPWLKKEDNILGIFATTLPRNPK